MLHAHLTRFALALALVATHLGAQTLLADIAPGNSSPQQLTSVGEQMFFVATTPATGAELFVTDGTEAGTRLVRDIRVGPQPSFIESMTAFGNRVLFIAQDGLSVTVWISDGTEAGTTRVAPSFELTTLAGVQYGPQIVIFQEGAYFAADDGVHGAELWKTDGTEAGTQLAAEVILGPEGGFPNNITIVDECLYFSAQADTAGFEPFRSDGTTEGTVFLGDVNTGSSGSGPADFFAWGDRIVFRAFGVSGYEVFSTDGTPDSAEPFLDLFGNASGLPTKASGTSFRFMEINGDLVFAGRDELGPMQLFKADTFGHVTLLTPGADESVAAGIHRLSDHVVFFQGVTSGSPGRLLSSDGIVPGASLIKDFGLLPGAFSEAFGQPGSNDLLVFHALDPVDGGDLWVTDGTLTGTVRLTDFPQGGPLTNLREFTRLGNQLLFSADDGIHGRELFCVPLELTGAHVAETFGTGCAGSLGEPMITSTGTPATGLPWAVELEGALPSAATFLLVSPAIGGTVVPGVCNLVPSAPTILNFTAGLDGTVTLPFTPTASTVGLRVVMQWAALDPAGEFLGAASVTKGLEVVFGP